MEDLFTLFKTLDRPISKEDVEIFTTATLPGATHRIGKDVNGNPVLLINTVVHEGGPQINLEHLNIQHSLRCRVTNSGTTEEGIFTIIRCTNANDNLVHYFLRSIDSVLRSLGPTPTSVEITHAISHLVELFRALVQPPIKSVAGLWAELVVIRNSKNPVQLLRAWHISPEARYDFNAGTQRIEVKSTSRRSRVHHFSFEQLSPPDGTDAVIVSVFAERSGGGLSLGEVVGELRDACAAQPELQARFDRVVAQTLGNALQRSLSERFDLELAANSVQVYRTRDVPKVSGEFPWGVSEVHFKADLGRSLSLSKEELSGAGGIFAQIFR